MQNNNLTKSQQAKQFVKKVLLKLHLYKYMQPFLKRLEHKTREMLRVLRIRWYARDIVPLMGKNRLYYSPHYIGHNAELSHSQNGQDRYIIEEVFNKSNGFFIEIGGNDPIKLSNSFYLEQLGWEGIAFEPISALCDKWKDARKTKCYPYLIGENDCKVDFEEYDGEMSVYSSVSGYGIIDHGMKPKIVKKTMRKLESVLSESGIHKVDVLFIDTEGYELNVIKSINLKEYPVYCIVAENAGWDGVSLELRRYLVNNFGYRLKAHIGGDDIFILPR